MTDEVPEDAIEKAEGVNTRHSHEGVSSEDASLVDHLRAVHHLDTEPQLSPATQDGLHDRLHRESKATDD